jgi:uncharacterized protein YdhG (YjbR/CyaY superfamily)
MASPDDHELEPKESGTDAVERRIEKVMAEMRDQSLIDINDEKTYHEKKVWCVIRCVLCDIDNLYLDCSIS